MKHTFVGKAAALTLLAMLCLGSATQAQVIVHGDVYGAGKGSASDKTIAVVKGNSEVDISAGQVYGNVYGGGQLSSVGTITYGGGGTVTDIATGTGQATVIVSGGTIGRDATVGTGEGQRNPGKSLGDRGFVFGGGKGDVGNSSTNSYLKNFAFVRNTDVSITGGYIVASVFGGSENGHVFTNTDVKVSGGKVGQELSDDATVVAGKKPYLEHQEIDGQGPAEIYFGNVYGGGRGIVPVDEESQIYSFTAGRVYGNTNVSITGGRVTHNVYGGGSLASVGDDSNPSTTGIATVSITGGIVGYDDGATTVNADGSLTGSTITQQKDFYLRAGINEGRVYGSGRGQVGSDENTYFPRLAFVQKTVVTVGGTAQVRGSVFGGGANGHVAQTTDVTITGNCLIGVPLKSAVDWGDCTWKVATSGVEAGYVDNNTLVDGGVEKLSSAYYNAETNFNGAHLHEKWVSGTGAGPTIYRGNVYGGGRGITPVNNDLSADIDQRAYRPTAGRVYQNTNVLVVGGTIFHDVFGGGSLASVGDSIIAGGTSIMGNSVAGTYHFLKAKATMDDTTLYDTTHAYTVGDPIYGTGTATVTIDGGTIGTDGVNNGGVYGGGRGVAGRDNSIVTHLANVTNSRVYIKSGTVKGAAFGGGANGHVRQNTYVHMSGGTVGTPLPLAERKVDAGSGHGFRVYRGNLYGGGRGVDVNHEGRLSNTAGRVYGNTHLLVSGGTVYHSIYGGGSLASVGTYVKENLGTVSEPNWKHYYVAGTGQAVVNVYGNAYIGHPASVLENDSYTTNDAYTAEALLTEEGIDWSSLTAEQKRAKYVELNYKYLGSNGAMVFGSGRGVGALDDDDVLNVDYAEAAFTHNTIVTLKDQSGLMPMVCGSVFGGGENGHVKHNTLVNIEGGRVGGIPLHDRSFKPYNANLHTASDHFSSTSSLTLSLEYEDVEDESGTGPTVYRGNVYGGGRGVDHSDNMVSTEGYSVSAGRVYGNTNVNISGGHVYHHVFGGGSLASVGTYEDNSNPDKSVNIFCYKRFKGNSPSDYTDEDTINYSTGKTTVTITGGMIGITGHNEGSVFGGGRGIAGTYGTEVTHLAFASNTEVNVRNGAQVMGSVFGGGANGHVLTDTRVNIEGGVVGHALEEADTLTTIYGYAPRTVFRGNVYGGGRGVDPTGPNKLSRSAGRVYGNTYVTMTGGWVRHSVFGGGSMASVGLYDFYGDTKEYSDKMDEIEAMADGKEKTDKKAALEELADSILHLKGWKDDDPAANKVLESTSGRATVKITGGWVGSRPSYANYPSNPNAIFHYKGLGDNSDTLRGQGGEGRNNGRVFGACRGTAGPMYDKLAYVNITRVIIGTPGSPTGPNIMGCVFGSGENGHVLDSTYVQMHSGVIGRGKVNDWKRTYIGNLYGGGRGIDLTHTNSLSNTAGWVRNCTRVEMTGGHVWHNVYGGGSLASVGPLVETPAYTNTYSINDRQGRTTVHITGGRVGHDGLFDGNVFGSGRGRAGQNTDTIFHVCNNECTYSPTGSTVTINGKSYKTTILNPATDNVLLRAYTPGDVDLNAESFFVVRNYNNTDDSTVVHDFSERTSVHNAQVIINMPYKNHNTLATETIDTASNHIAGSVYGSGDNGHVLNYAYVGMHGGLVGTRLDGWDKDVEPAWMGSLTAKDKAEAKANISDEGMVLTSGSVYGSGRGLDLTNVGNSMSSTAGRVYGYTMVKVTGGKLLRNVYGGGNMAGVGQGTTSGVNKEITSFDPLTGTATVYITGGIIGEDFAIESDGHDAGGNIFGSSRGLSSDQQMIRNMSFVRESHIYIEDGVASTSIDPSHKDSADQATFTVMTVAGGSEIRGSVFGGGENGHVWDNTYVNISGTVEIGYNNPSALTEPIYTGNVYGGGRGIDLTGTSKIDRNSGVVYGNTNVNITGGRIWHNVHGGGSVASVGRYVFNDGTYPSSPADSVLSLATVEAGNKIGDVTVAATTGAGGKATVNISGTAKIGQDATNNGRVFGAGRGIAGLDGDGNGFNYYTFVDQTEVNIDGNAEIYGSVYGSGDNGHVTGNTQVNIKNGTIGYNNGGALNGNVFGSGRGTDRGRRKGKEGDGLKYYSETAGRVRGNTQVNVTGGTIKNNVYGGGLMAGVLGNTEVNIGTVSGTPSDFTIYGDVFGGSALGSIGSPSGTTTLNILSGTVGSTSSYYYTANGSLKGNIFGGGNGDAGASGLATEAVDVYKNDGTDDKITSRPANVLNAVQVNIGTAGQMGNNSVGATVMGMVFGGNNIAGSPQHDVNVDVYHTFHNSTNEFPTALKSLAEDYDVYDKDDEEILHSDAGATTLAALTTNGVAGSEAYFALQAVYGGGNKANYSGDQYNQVTIHGCAENTIQYVYGGGAAASSIGTNVTIEGGRMYMVFAGGDGHTGVAADITENASVVVKGGFVESLFGGSNMTGIVHGVSSVSMDPGDCGMHCNETFGGGNEAAGGEVVVTIPCSDKYYHTVYGGAKNANTGSIDNHKNITLNIEGSKIGQVFGGNKNGGTIYGDVYVNIYGGTIGEVFGGSNMGGRIEGSIYVLIDSSNCADYCPMNVDYVYGGGNECSYDPSFTGAGDHSPFIYVRRGTVDKAVFGGGKGTTSLHSDTTVNANPTILIGNQAENLKVTVGDEAGVGDVFGGGNLMSVSGNTTIVVDGNKTYVRNNVYGGGNQAKVTGNTDVRIGASTDKDNADAITIPTILSTTHYGEKHYSLGVGVTCKPKPVVP